VEAAPHGAAVMTMDIEGEAAAGPAGAPAVDAKRANGRRTINLALQGGGAHGAFTWGVLDRLLEDERLEIEGISGTSAGAINGAMLVCGMSAGGREGARRRLRQFWARVAEMARYSPLQPSWLDRMTNGFNLDSSPTYQLFDLFTRLWSPYQFNPTGHHPVRDVLTGLIDFECVKHSHGPKLFVSATNVRSGKIRVFDQNTLSIDALLASACLPVLHQAVEIDGEHYWDGGFMGNPAMFPLIYNCRAPDIVLIEINPISVPDVPHTARAIIDRMNTIGFNATMMREMRTIAFVSHLLEKHRLTNRSQLRRIFFHRVEAETELAEFGVSSKLNPDGEFLAVLFQLGRTKADGWLAQNFDKIGKDSTIDLDALFY
jgi:NTE family protein